MGVLRVAECVGGSKVDGFHEANEQVFGQCGSASGNGIGVSVYPGVPEVEQFDDFRAVVVVCHDVEVFDASGIFGVDVDETSVGGGAIGGIDEGVFGAIQFGFDDETGAGPIPRPIAIY